MSVNTSKAMKNGDKRELEISELTHIKTCRSITILSQQVSSLPRTPSFPHFKSLTLRFLSHATLFSSFLLHLSVSCNFFQPASAYQTLLFSFPAGDIGDSVVGISVRAVFAAAMPPRRYAFGRADEATHPDSIRATLAEFVSTFIFVFVGEGSVLALDKILRPADHGGYGPGGYDHRTADTGRAPSDFVVIAVAHAFALFSAVAASINVSGGHVNPAVTFGALLGGRVSLIRAVFYWIAQILGAIVASLLLRLATGGMRPIGFFVSSGVGELHGFLLEVVLTFALVYTVYATAIDPKRGSLGTIAPLAIGLIVGANILMGGPFDGACMNPARAFGPSLVGWRWDNHWIYWIGPLLGGGLAALVYEYLVIPVEPPLHTHQPLAPEDY